MVFNLRWFCTCSRSVFIKIKGYMFEWKWIVGCLRPFIKILGIILMIWECRMMKGHIVTTSCIEKLYCVKMLL